MIVFRIPCCLAFLLLVNFCAAQNRSYNTIFDTLVVHDTTAPVIEDTGSWQVAKKQEGYILTKLLYYSGHPDKEWFWYLHNASCDTTLPKSTIDTIKICKHSVATRLLEWYFYQDSNKDSDDWYEIVNAVKVNSEVLEDYIHKLPTLRERKYHEERIFYWLVQSGKEDTALNLLKVMVADSISGKERLFELLCFSNNKAIRLEAIKLLFTCLEYMDDRMLRLGLCVDEATAVKYVQKRFWYYANQKQGSAPPPLPKDLWRNERITPQPLKSLMTLMQRYSACLSKALGGKKFWTEYATRIPYWDAYYGFMTHFQLPVLEAIFTDSTLTNEEKQHMLLALSDHGYRKNNVGLRYLQLVKQAWPDGNIPEYEFTKLNLCNMVAPQSPVTYPEFKPRFLDVTETIADIKKAGVADVQLNTEYYRYIGLQDWYSDSYGVFDENFNLILTQTGLIRDICITCFGKPASYKQLFNEKFEALLVKIGVWDIELHEEIIRYKTGYLYKLVVRSNEAAYKMEFEGNEYGPFHPQRLVKLINLLLMKKGVKERFIELDYHHYGLEFGLFEPDRIKPLLDKYYVRCFAVGNGGELSDWRKVELKTIAGDHKD